MGIVVTVTERRFDMITLAIDVDDAAKIICCSTLPKGLRMKVAEAVIGLSEEPPAAKSSTKTIREWFESVGDPVKRAQLLRNMEEPEGVKMASCLSDAVEKGFDWAFVSEGNNAYWNAYYDELKGKGL